MIFHIITADTNCIKTVCNSGLISELYTYTQAKKLYYRETYLDATKPIKYYFSYNMCKNYIYDKPTKITNKINSHMPNTPYEQNKQINKLETQVSKLQIAVKSERRIQYGIFILGVYLVTITSIPYLF